MSGEGEVRALARWLRALPPSCGPVRLVAVDGHAGAGKSTLSRRLAAELGGAPVVRLDDVASHAAPFGWLDRLTAQVTEPLAHGETACMEVYDWERREFGEPVAVEPADVVLLEGVGAGRRALRPLLACLVWMDMPEWEAWARGRRRDGEELSGFWDDWTAAERDHFAGDPSYGFAHVLVREGPGGYEVLPGPVRMPGLPWCVTLGEGAGRDAARAPGGRPGRG